MIFKLDLNSTKKYLEKKFGWSREKSSITEFNYKNFLLLFVNHPGEIFIPDADVDEMWHAHILDTQKYMNDCQKIFGYYLHHCPAPTEKIANDAIFNERMETTQRALAKLGTGSFARSAFCTNIPPPPPPPPPRPSSCLGIPNSPKGPFPRLRLETVVRSTTGSTIRDAR